ncbi:Peroxin 14-like protein isoform 2, partial [Theobroma cacao]
MREELVEMAAKFLLHPTVRRTPVSYRRSFLEKKGLTSDEIDEAFHRVPDTPSSLTFGQDINSNQDVQSNPFASFRLQDTEQSSQPLAASMLTASPPSRFSWSNAIFSLVLLILSGAGTSMLLKKFFLPRLKSWICKVVLEEDDDKGRNSNLSLSKEAIEAAKAAAAASVDAAKASLEILQSKKEEARHLDVLVRCLGTHVAELRSITTTIRRLEGTREAALRKLQEQYIQHASQNGVGLMFGVESYNQCIIQCPHQEACDSSSVFRNGPDSKLPETSTVHTDHPGNFVSNSTKFKPSGISNFDSSVRPSSTPLRASAGQHPKSYMEILAMIQRGEK